MPAPKNPSTQITEITLAFSAPELSQLEAIAALHGESVTAFIHNAALEAAHIAPAQRSAKISANDTSALWLNEAFANIPEPRDEETPDLFASVSAPEGPEAVVASPVAATPAPKRGVAGEQSALAKGHGLVWEIRRALGRERVYGLGWTREQLAFVLKLSVVGVRKMEHEGTSPVKSLESRKALLGLAKTLETPGEETLAYIEREETALG